MKKFCVEVLVGGMALAFIACKSPVKAPPVPQAQTQALTTSALTAGLVVAAIPLSPSDEVLRGRLEALGYVVQLIDDDATLASDAAGKALLVVSESSASAKILDKYRTAAVPVVSMEVAIWDDLGMTGGGWRTDFGDAVGVASIAISSRGHPLAAQLPTGNAVVASSTSKVMWGKPTPSASVVAGLVDDATKATVFGYEAGDAMVNGFTAPARRVAFFAGDPTPASFTQQGGKLFDAAVTWATRTREMLFVVGNSTLTPADQALFQHAQRIGFGVHIREGTTVQATDAANKAVVLISESTVSATVDTRLRNIPVPVLSLEPALFDEFGMTGPTWLSDYGDVAAQTEIQITNPTHALAAGLSGRVQVSTQATKFLWGAPAATAAKIATIVAQNPDSAVPTEQAFAIFGYPAGAAMFNLTAPASRVGWLAGDPTALSLTEIGWRLFDAALLWTTDAKGPCEGRPNGFACNDGDACTTGDACSSGVCTAGAALVCNDQNPCTIDSCSNVLGCQATPNPDPSVCDNGTPVCASPGNAPPASAAIVTKEGFEDCADAWVDSTGKENPSVQYVVDQAWGACTNTTGRVLKVDASALGSRYRSSWFKLVPIAPAQTYCLSVWINWKAGGMPFVDLQTYDQNSAVEGSPQRVIGSEGAPVVGTPGFHRYHQTFSTSATTHFLQVEHGITPSISPKPGEAQSLFDDVVIAAGACPTGGV